jgi:hypothetical protein
MASYPRERERKNKGEGGREEGNKKEEREGTRIYSGQLSYPR